VTDKLEAQPWPTLSVEVKYGSTVWSIDALFSLNLSSIQSLVSTSLAQNAPTDHLGLVIRYVCIVRGVDDL
jgi:hypothetical protein